jgi:hypothetical protein
MQFRAAVVIVACATVPVLTAGQRAAADEQQTDHSALAGTWQLDEAQSRLAAENWHDRLHSRRELAPCLPTLTRPGEPVTYDCRSAYELPQAGPPNMMGESALVMFGRPLLQASPTLTLLVGTSAVTIGGDLLETRTFAASGQPEKVDVIVNHSVRWPSTRPLRVVTHWVGTSLVQEKQAAFSGVTIALTETYLPTESGQQLFVIIDVRKPTLTSAVRPIKRLYVRMKQVPVRSSFSDRNR